MIRNKNLFYYLGVAMVMLLMHKGYALADLHQLRILLQPVAFLVGFTSGSPVIFVPSEGFFLPSLNILIDRTCSGFHFWMICFAMLSWLGLQYATTHQRKFVAVTGAWFTSFLLTLPVNAVRIRFSLLVQTMGDVMLGERPHHRMHETAGVLIHLLSLISIYMLALFIYQKFRKHEITSSSRLDFSGKYSSSDNPRSSRGR